LKKRSFFMKKIFLLVLLICYSFVQAILIWSEDFDSYANGTTSSSKWSISNSTGGTFQVLNQQFDGSDVVNPGATWTSEVIDLTSYQNSTIVITVDLGVYHTSGSGLEATDYLYLYYSIDGGTNTFFDTNGNNNDDTWAPSRVASQTGLPAGDELEIIIVAINSEVPEHYTFDNIEVNGDLELSGTHSVSGRVWYDNDENDTINSGELGIGSAIVEVYSEITLINLVAQTTTASNGDYSFSGLEENTTYYVYVDESSMGGDDVYARVTIDNPKTISLITTDVTGVNFGYVWVDDCMPTMFFNYDAAGNPINAGDYITEQFAAWGIHISTNDPTNHPTMAFDSENPTGGDYDLGTPNQYWIRDGSRAWVDGVDDPAIRGPGVGFDGGPTGLGPNRYPLGNLIIISQDNNPSNPNDYAGGGSITFDFDQPMRIYEVTFVDDHDAQGGDVVTTYDANYDVIGHYSLPDLGENSFQVALIDDYNVKRMVFTLQGSGAMSGVRFCPEGEELTLSVTLSTFSAIYQNHTPTLKWITQSEQNNSHWNVYRSISENIGQAVKLNHAVIAGAGNSVEPTNYTFHDPMDMDIHLTYWYWIESVDFSGESVLHGPVSFVIPESDNSVTPQISETYGMLPNFPNPFNPSTTIQFRLVEDDFGTVSIYNLKGQRIKEIYTGEFIKNEIQYIVWDGTDKNDNDLPTGIYFAKVQTKKTSLVRRLLMMK
jgi:hypothetical protein